MDRTSATMQDMAIDIENDRACLEALLVKPARLGLGEEELEAIATVDHAIQEAVERVGLAIGAERYTCMVASTIAKVPRRGMTMEQHADRVSDDMLWTITAHYAMFSSESFERMAAARAEGGDGCSYRPNRMLTHLAAIGSMIAYHAASMPKSEAIRQAALQYAHRPEYAAALELYRQQALVKEMPVRPRQQAYLS